MNIRMSTKGKRPLRSLTPSDKIHAIQRIHDGESKASVARDIGVPESTLRGWCKNEDKLRFMSRQSAPDKMVTDVLSDKMDAGVGLLGGPPEKRQKMDPSLPLNFSNKLKYEDMGYKRSPLNGLDYSTNKTLSDISFNSLAPDYAAFNGAVKNKVFGADIARQADPTMAAISPLSSLSHLSGLTGISHSPLAISFSELTSNLNLLAQLNPGLAAMSGFNGLATSASPLRSIKTKIPPQSQSPQSENGDRKPGLSVKNWAKQQGALTASSENSYGLNSSLNDSKNKIKCPSPSLAPSLGGNLPALSAMTEDPLLYWLKSQQAIMGLNNLYPQQPISASSPPIRSSTPQQPNQHVASAPIVSSPLTPLSTPSGSLDDKNAAWYNWCKAFGASLNSLGPMAVAMQAPTASAAGEAATNFSSENQKPPFENILYSHLTKNNGSPSVHSSSSAENLHNNENNSNTDSGGKPEDLSAKSTKTISPVQSPLPILAKSPAQSPTQSPRLTPAASPVRHSEPDTNSPSNHRADSSIADCKDVLNTLLYKINNNRSVDPECEATPASADAGSESGLSFTSESNHNNNDVSASNNNNNSNKTDEEEENLKNGVRSEDEDHKAIKHGEKFLKWLENCSNPRVTSVQLMQLRFLISAIKSSSTETPKTGAGECIANDSPSADDNLEESSRCKTRRRK